MKLRKQTRKRIYEAAVKHKSVTIAWPASAPEPLPGHKYSVKGFDGETRLVVERRKKRKTGGYEAEVRLDNDPIRLPWGLSPLRTAEGDLETEPEMVPRPWLHRRSMEGSQKTTLMGKERRLNGESERLGGVVERERLKGNTSGANAAKRRADRLPRAA